MSEDPKVFGELTEEEIKVIEGLQASSRGFTYDIGQLELRKVYLISRINEIERNIQKTLTEVKARLGVPDNCKWQVSDGKVILTSEPPKEVGEPTEEVVDE